MSARVRYGNLSRHARDVIRWWYGHPVKIAGYVRHWFPDGVWRATPAAAPTTAASATTTTPAATATACP